MAQTTTSHASLGTAPFELAAYAANLAEDKKAKDVLVLDTQEVSSLSDYFVIASVDSRTQMQALAETIVQDLRKQGIYPIGLEIDKEGRWSLIDFGDVVVHLFHQEDRNYYCLERFWSHATEIKPYLWQRTYRQAS